MPYSLNYFKNTRGNMTYNKLLDLYKNGNSTSDEAILKILQPKPLKDAGELEQIVSSRFRYTGPGKWTRIIREKTDN